MPVSCNVIMYGSYFWITSLLSKFKFIRLLLILVLRTFWLNIGMFWLCFWGRWSPKKLMMIRMISDCHLWDKATSPNRRFGLYVASFVLSFYFWKVIVSWSCVSVMDSCEAFLSFLFFCLRVGVGGVWSFEWLREQHLLSLMTGDCNSFISDIFCLFLICWIERFSVGGGDIALIRPTNRFMIASSIDVLPIDRSDGQFLTDSMLAIIIVTLLFKYVMSVCIWVVVNSCRWMLSFRC